MLQVIADVSGPLQLITGMINKVDHFKRVDIGMTMSQWQAEDLLPRCRGREVVLLGRKVARVAGLDAPPFSWVARRAWCQHPSGINIWWNEERNVRAARRFWRDLIRRGLPRIPS